VWVKRCKAIVPKATAPRAIPAPSHIFRCFDPASAGLKLKRAMNAMTKAIEISFFHIWCPPFLGEFFNLCFFDEEKKEFIQGEAYPIGKRKGGIKTGLKGL
jgi:hypothetical protein